MPKYLNLENQKFGRLTALYPCCKLNKTQVIIYWICICDCGNQTQVQSAILRNGATKSCGCIQKEYARIQGGKNRLEKSVSGFNYLLSNYKRRAKDKNRIFSLSNKEFKQLTSLDCHYCGQKPSQKISVKNKDYNIEARNHSEYIYNGLDRKNSDEGYILSNSVPCCWICNRAKLDMSYEEFIKWIHRLKGI